MAILRRFFRGNKAENDAYTGGPGKVSFDTETQSVRIHDGVTPGGHEVAELRDLEEIFYTIIHSGNVDGQDVTNRVGDTYGWRDPFTEIKIQGRGANDPTWSPFRNGLYAYTFAAGKMTECWTTFHVDHDYALGSKLYPHVHWAPATTGTGTVRWGFEFTVAKGHGQGNASVFPSSTTVYVEQSVTNQQYMHLITETPEGSAIPPDFVEPDSLILMRIFRDSVNDTYPGSVFVFAADLHYQIARLSTRNKAPDFFD